MNNIEKLKKQLEYGDWFASLKYVVNEELVKDWVKLRRMLEEPNPDEFEIGKMLHEIGAKFGRVRETLGEAEHQHERMVLSVPELMRATSIRNRTQGE